MSRAIRPFLIFKSFVPYSSNFRKKRLSWQRSLRYFYHRFVRMRGSPEALARGIASGVFAGWFPWFGFQMIIAIALATVIRGNKITAAASTWVSNPFTYVPIFAFNYQVGNWILDGDMLAPTITGVESGQEILHLGADLLTSLLLGCFVIGLGVAIASYFGSVWLIHHLRHRRNQRRSRQRHRRMNVIE